MIKDKRISILCMNDFFDSVIDSLKNDFNFYYLNEVGNSEVLIEGILTTPWSKVDENLISRFPNLKIICCFGTGIDSVDKKSAFNKGVLITNTPNIVTEDTADIALILLLSLARNIIPSIQHVKSGKWKTSPASLGTSVFGKTLGILGLGKIGLKIAERASSFGLNIIYHNRRKVNVSYEYYDSLHDMAKHSDFLVVSCTGCEETKNIVDINILKALGNSGFLINVSRGITINEDDLILCLKDKVIAGAGLDVYLNEPSIREEFFHFDNLITLPHIGTATVETRFKMLNLTIDNMKSYFFTGIALTPVNN